MAVDNGNLMGNEPYGEESIHMYHGCASVMDTADRRNRTGVYYGGCGGDAERPDSSGDGISEMIRPLHPHGITKENKRGKETVKR